MRTRILSAARNLVHEAGYTKLSLRAIARKIDYSPAGLYEYFSGKDAIIQALCKETETLLVTQMDRSVQQNTTDHPLLTMGLSYIEFALQNSDDFQLLFQHNTGRDSNQIIESFIDRVEDSIDNGEFIPSFDFDDQEIAHSCWSLAHGLAMLCLTREEYSSVDDLSIHREIFQRLLTGIRT